MKQVYILAIVGLAFIAVSIPQQGSAQCLCSGGIAATPITQSVTIAPTQTSVLTFTFQQFDPTIGTLSCVTMRDTISGVSTTYVLNTDPVDTIPYLFQLTVNNKISGPGIIVNQIFNKTYGYDTLNPAGQPGDTITYGPDNIFNHATGSGSTGGNPAYIGMGTVDFTYKINGGLVALDGGLNYKDSISTIIGGTINLTYYWCPSSPLGSLINSFTAIKKDKYILLQWLATNDQNNANYEIEYSKDGNEYLPVGNVPAGTNAAGTITQYQYQYNPDPSDVGKLYFRIKRTDANGNTVYSTIKEVDLSAQNRIGIQTYPNPVVNSVLVQFDENQNGNFMLELVNITGQILEQKKIILSGTNLTRFDLNSNPAKGIYFLRAKNMDNNEQWLSKIMVK
ncbi:MAG TPA: choice-of-anchor E domain-containing protein [Puia sp.]|nr:choice-of-anchor E domain-containing protein [Puia sp.]